MPRAGHCIETPASSVEPASALALSSLSLGGRAGGWAAFGRVTRGPGGGAGSAAVVPSAALGCRHEPARWGRLPAGSPDTEVDAPVAWGPEYVVDPVCVTSPRTANGPCLIQLVPRPVV